MLNTMACLALFGAAAYAGHAFARGVENRPKALTAMRQAMHTLQTRLQYYNESLRAAFRNTAGEVQGAFGEVYRLAAERIAQGETTQAAIQAALLEMKRKDSMLSSLQDGDVEILSALAGRIGADNNAQTGAFALAFDVLEAAQQEAKQEKDSRAKLYRTAGLLTGALLVILFI